MNEFKASLEIEKLIKYGIEKGMVHPLDEITTRNELLDLLDIKEPYEGQLDYEVEESPTKILNSLLDYAAEKGIIPFNTTTYRDLLDGKIMGALMPKQSQVVGEFFRNYEHSPRKATEFFYSLSKDSNYIRMDRIEKNLYWLAPTEYGDLEITVNLSKPEKDPKDIAASKLRPQSQYPKCLLCLENIGYAGHVNHPARQNHRVIPITLGGENWYFQYSPYVYYNEHCILFYEKHSPMKISHNTFKRLIEFIEKIPHYFVGTNADLPIVGGSILTHDHFQGGNHEFPMEKAPVEECFSHNQYTTVKGGIVKWPMSVLRLSSKHKEDLEKLCCNILDRWRGYSDETLDILSHSLDKGETVPHNTITPIARINKAGEYEVDLVLRNNRTSTQHPLGIFHPHSDLHHIKKENIGLIEVMGLAVLPGRLEQELKGIEDILCGRAKEISEELTLHKPWVEELINHYGTELWPREAEEAVKKEVGQKFLRVLEDAGLYKRNQEGRVGFIRLLEELGFKKI